MNQNYDVIIIGAGFTGLSAGLALTRAKKTVLILESDEDPGGLAGIFSFKNGIKVEKYYHHWFNNDFYVPKLVESLGLSDQVLKLPSKTGMYYNGRLWKLSSPIDLLKFTPLKLHERLRLGWTILKIRRIKHWKLLEALSIREWLEPLCGKNAFRIIWEPLIKAKFSIFAEKVNAVWMWKKLVLRGSTRSKGGREELAYFKGGFGRLAQMMVDEIRRAGGEVLFNHKVMQAIIVENKIRSLKTARGEFSGKQYLFTPALAIVADIFEGVAEQRWINTLRRVQYLGNICLVLQLKHSLSEIYWININDPGFPFVGIIEHTNFDAPENYGNCHIVYLSRYLAKSDPVWQYNDEQYLNFALTHLKRMFPDFDVSWIIDYHIWRADYAQPITERFYSQYVPGRETPFENAKLSTMAHIYPEDRGTNYAIREGLDVAKQLM
ncbi:MAG: NAD(P)/FAD-dependent oxidoreductase [Gammaproteobacteria bacterium]